MSLMKTMTSLSLLLAGSALLVAQDTSGTLTGTVRTKAGQPVVNARVSLTSPKLLGERVAYTDAKGNYRIPLLPTGDYAVAFSAKGFFTNKGKFTLIAGQILRQDGVIASESEVQGGAGAVVEISIAAAQVDKTDTVTQTAYTGEKLSQLVPFNSSQMTEMVSMSPGVQGDYESASIRGGVGAANALVMNGGSVKSMVKNLFEMRITIQDMVESASVVQSAMNAKFGNSDGGAIVWTTARGSNEFSGTLRRTNISREMWRAGAGYQIPNRRGEAPNRLDAYQDNLRGQWEATIKGPIIKDKLTFAYGTVLIPDSSRKEIRAKSFSDTPQDNDPGSIFYDNGTQVFRNPQRSSYDGKLTDFLVKDSWHQLALYYQLNPSHQLEFGYTKQFHSDPLNPQEWVEDNPFTVLPASNLGYNGLFEQDRRMWNIGYKGIIGANGVLEARLSHKKEAYNHHTTSTPGVRSYYMSNKIVDPQTGSDYVAPKNMLEWWFAGDNGITLAENGIGYGDHDTLETLSNNLSYQHILQASGQHVIDVGYAELGSKLTDVNVKDLNFRTPVRLSDADAGGSGANVPMYVVVPYNATIADVAGGNVSWPGYGMSIPGGNLLRDQSNVYGRYLITTMWKSAGPGDGVMESMNRAFYLNDQWSINDYHSVMVGVRYDKFKVWDVNRTIHSYGQFTPRFEYKWDIGGDQRRVVSLSYGQFAQTPQSAYFSPYAQGFLPYRTREYWTGAAMHRTDTKPYLVSLNDLTNPANYGYINRSQVRGAAGAGEILDPSVRGTVSSEWSLGFRRSFANGSSYRVTYVQKTWDHIFDYFPASQGTQQTYPQDYFPGVASTPILARILKEDPEAQRTYRGVELEWTFVFTPAVTFAGNYTYSRMYANGNTEVLANPMNANNVGANWRGYYDTLLPRDQYDPVRMRQGGHVFNAWTTIDLSTGKLKQSLVIRGKYSSGNPTYAGYTYNIARPTVPNYPSTTGLPTTLTQLAGPDSGFMTTDSWSTSLRYNLEIPVYKKVAWFLAVDMGNWLNTIARSGYDLNRQFTLGSKQGNINWADRNTYLAQGLPVGADTRAAEGRFGFRSVTLETGIRF